AGATYRKSCIGTDLPGLVPDGSILSQRFLIRKAAGPCPPAAHAASTAWLRARQGGVSAAHAAVLCLREPSKAKEGGVRFAHRRPTWRRRGSLRSPPPYVAKAGFAAL